MKTTIDAMKHALSLLSDGPDVEVQLCRDILKTAIEREEAQTVEPISPDTEIAHALIACKDPGCIATTGAALFAPSE